MPVRSPESLSFCCFWVELFAACFSLAGFFVAVYHVAPFESDHYHDTKVAERRDGKLEGGNGFNQLIFGRKERRERKEAHNTAALCCVLCVLCGQTYLILCGLRVLLFKEDAQD